MKHAMDWHRREGGIIDKQTSAGFINVKQEIGVTEEKNINRDLEALPLVGYWLGVEQHVLFDFWCCR